MSAATKTPEYYVGLMSGTSVDAIDAALVDFSGSRPRLVAHHEQEIPTKLQQEIIVLCNPGDNEIERMGQADVAIATLFAEATQQLLIKAAVPADQVIAIGSHGQTIRHRPDVKHPFTLQIGDPNVIAELTGITTIADFRRRDLANGGQGAPLAPILHAEVFADSQDHRAILNVGGMANLTLLGGGNSNQNVGISDNVIGFDTGPGNVLLDAWIQQQQGLPYDSNGEWSAGGTPNAALLSQLCTEPYFDLPPPKSTGRELFNPAWLQQHLDTLPQTIPAQDVAATLIELVAQTVATALKRHFPQCASIYVCGGGAHNGFLLERLAKATDCPVSATDELGIPADWVEAIAFACLARRRLALEPGNIKSVTGARNDCVLGGVYHCE